MGNETFYWGGLVKIRAKFDLRWLKTVSSTNISMGHCNHSLSLDATIMVSKHCPIIGEHVVVFSIT